MRKNKTGGRRHHHQRIIEAPKKYNGKPNTKAGQVKLITHHSAKPTQ